MTSRSPSQFKPGQSGNPKGRPKGSKNQSTLIQQEIGEKLLSNKNLERDAVKVLEKGLEMAKNGDKGMMKFFLNKFIPDTSLAFGKDGEGSSQPVVNITIGNTDEPVTIEQSEDGNETTDE